MKSILMAGGMLLFVPLALCLIAGAIVASLVAGVALVAIAIKLAPLVALVMIGYWIATRQRRRMLGSGR